MTASRCLVLGIGNLLLSDEGVGIYALRELETAEDLPDVDLLDGGTGGIQLLSCFQDYECLVILDATLDGRPPGTVAVSEPRFASDFPRVLTAHDIGLRDLIEAASLLGPLPRMFLITISIDADQPMAVELSPPIRAAIPSVVTQVHSVLHQLV
jgi:hydrogenase maturation protease